MELFGALDERCWWVKKQTHSRILRGLNTARSRKGVIVKYAIFSHDMSHLLPIKALDWGACMYKAPIANRVGRL